MTIDNTTDSLMNLYNLLNTKYTEEMFYITFPIKYITANTVLISKLY